MVHASVCMSACLERSGWFTPYCFPDFESGLWRNGGFFCPQQLLRQSVSQSASSSGQNISRWIGQRRGTQTWLSSPFSHLETFYAVTSNIWRRATENCPLKSHTVSVLWSRMWSKLLLFFFFSHTSSVTLLRPSFNILKLSSPRIMFYCLSAKWARRQEGGLWSRYTMVWWILKKNKPFALFFTILFIQKVLITTDDGPVTPNQLRAPVRTVAPSYLHVFGNSAAQAETKAKVGWCGQKTAFLVRSCGESFIRCTQEPQSVPYIQILCFDSAAAYQFVKCEGEAGRRPSAAATTGWEVRRDFFSPRRFHVNPRGDGGGNFTCRDNCLDSPCVAEGQRSHDMAAFLTVSICRSIKYMLKIFNPDSHWRIYIFFNLSLLYLLIFNMFH